MPDIPDEVWDEIVKDLEMSDVPTTPEPEPAPEPADTPEVMPEPEAPNEPQPEQTDNSVREEDGEQNVSQDPQPAEGSV